MQAEIAHGSLKARAHFHAHRNRCDCAFPSLRQIDDPVFHCHRLLSCQHVLTADKLPSALRNDLCGQFALPRTPARKEFS